MKFVNWNLEKNAALKESRGIDFEDILFHMERGDILDDYEHPNQDKYEGQRIMVIAVDDYAYLVPYVEDELEIFLKTIIPSRKATQRYLGAKNEN